MFNRRKKGADQPDEALELAAGTEATQPETTVEATQPETTVEATQPEVAADVAGDAVAAHVSPEEPAGPETPEDVLEVARSLEDEDEGDAEPRRGDPLVGLMLMTTLVLIVVILASTALLVFYLLSLRGAPRTAAERRVTIAQAAVETDQSKEKMLELARAFMQVGRYDDALDTIDRGRRTEDVADYYVAEADLYRVQERYDKALEVYAKAEELDEKEFKALVADLEARGIIIPLERQTRVAILVGRGETLLEQGQDEDALVAFREAAELQPTNALLHIRIGDLLAEAGETEAAKASYEEALRYVPDNEDALKALDRIKQAEEE